MPTTSFKRGFNRYGFQSRRSFSANRYSRVGAAKRIQRVWRSRGRIKSTVKRTMRQQLPTDYYQATATMSPQSGAGGNTLENVMLVPFTIANTVGSRTGDRIFFKGLTIKWSIHCQRDYDAANTPGKVRFGLIEARGTALTNDIILYNPQNTVGGVNDTDAIFNHAKVKVIFDRTLTMGDVNSYDKQGYRDHVNVKTFTKCNQNRMFIENNPLSPVRTTQRNWYVFAIASGYDAGEIRVTADHSFSFKDLA